MLLVCAEDLISMNKCRQPLSGEKLVLGHRRLLSLPSFLDLCFENCTSSEQELLQSSLLFFHRGTTVILKDMQRFPEKLGNLSMTLPLGVAP